MITHCDEHKNTLNIMCFQGIGHIIKCNLLLWHFLQGFQSTSGAILYITPYIYKEVLSLKIFINTGLNFHLLL